MIDPNKSVASLVLDHSEFAAVLQRHKIDYCCHGDITLAEACRARRLDVEAVTRALEAALRDDHDETDARTLATPALVEHIVSRYHAPLRKTLPFVRMLAAKVARVHGEHNPRLKHLDEVVAELAETLEQHLDDEEATLFPSLAKGGADGLAVPLAEATRADHEGVGELLGWMRSAAEDYSVPDWACNSYRTLFRELERLEADIHRHVHLENHVLLPRVANAARCA